MNLSFFEKLRLVFQYAFSSFLSIEMFMLSLLLFIILTVNLKRKNHLIERLAVGVYIGFLVGVLISYTTYVKTCVHSFAKVIMNYVYFPSTVVYFFIIVFVTGMVLWTLFSKKMTMFKKIFNYFFFGVLYFLFMSFVAMAAYDGVDLIDTAKLYQNNNILCFVQMSNFILLIWLVFTLFYHLFLLFKKKYG